VNGIAFYSCYLPSSLSLPQAISALEEIAEDARENRPTVIAGDFNAWATEWGSPRTNARGPSAAELWNITDFFKSRQPVLSLTSHL